MRRALILSSLCATAWCASSPVQAIGFGRTDTPSLLGQPLDFAAHLRVESDEELARECITAEVFAGESRIGADQVRIGMRAGNQPGDRTIRVSTLRAVNEPVVTINLVIGCKSQVSRKFVAFLDPPVLYLARAEEPAPTELQFQGHERQPETQIARVQAEPAAMPAAVPPARPRVRHAERRRSVAPAARYARASQAPTADIAASKREPRKVSVARASLPAKATGAARLQLESASAAPVAAPAASAVAAAQMPGSLMPVTPPVNVEAEQLKVLLAQERERVRTLEAGLARLRSESDANQKRAAAAVQAAVPKIEPERAASPMLYPLVGFGGLLVVAMGMALWRPRAKPFGTSRWWDLTQQPSAQQAVVVPSRFDSIRSESEDLRAQLPPRVASALSASTLGNSIDTPIGGLEIRTITSAPEHPRADSSDTLPMSLPEVAPKAAAAEPSMEALIDLEQEADFFIVIGQDDAAADLLSKHLKSDGVTSALPFLKLLEIHRRRGDKSAHGAVAESFQRRFGAPAPSWNGSATGGRGLDAYPAMIARLQTLWASPRDVMRALETSLFRRDPTDELLDLAAYRDLLFLYAVARDRSDTTPAEDIDVLLPIDDAPVDVHLPILPSQSHVTMLHPRVSRSAPLDFDISLSFEQESELRQAV